jgi:protein SDA1
MKQRVSVTLKLPQLQNLIKRDPAAYKDEFLMQKRHFDSELDIFKLRPTKESERFTELVTFMSHVAVCYKEECDNLAPSIMELLETHATILHTDVRAKLLQALIMLRNKGMIDPLNLIRLAFKLFSVNDKTLRLSLVEYIFNDIKTINHQKQNDKLNRSIQAFLFSIVEDDTTVTARKTVEILCELYRRKVWTDARTVNMLGKACLSQSTRVSVAAINFFLGIETKMHEDEDEEKATDKGTAEVDYHAHSKKTKKRQRHTQKQIEHNAKLRRDSQKQGAIAQPLFPAIQMLHDPQSLAEKLFKKLRQSGGERFEVKLLLMNFTSRLIGCHKLLLLSFYSFLQRYLTAHQQDITHILAYLIQACHELVPPEDLVPVVKAIAYNFITERCTNEAITVGINAVREIIVRSPSLLREPDMGDFVQDLAMYGKKTHKSVMIAAHGMVNLVRYVRSPHLWFLFSLSLCFVRLVLSGARWAALTGS